MVQPVPILGNEPAFGDGFGGFGGGGGGGGGFRRGIDEATLRSVADRTGATDYSAESADQLQVGIHQPGDRYPDGAAVAARRA